MGLWQTIKSLFASGGFAPADAPRLKAGNESELLVSLRALPDGERGWITLAEARNFPRGLKPKNSEEGFLRSGALGGKPHC